MRLVEIIVQALCVLCAVIAAFCLGFAIETGERHVFFLAVFYGILSYLIARGIRSDRKREEERRKNNWRE